MFASRNVEFWNEFQKIWQNGIASDPNFSDLINKPEQPKKCNLDNVKKLPAVLILC